MINFRTISNWKGHFRRHERLLWSINTDLDALWSILEVFPTEKGTLGVIKGFYGQLILIWTLCDQFWKYFQLKRALWTSLKASMANQHWFGHSVINFRSIFNWIRHCRRQERLLWSINTDLDALWSILELFPTEKVNVGAIQALFGHVTLLWTLCDRILE